MKKILLSIIGALVVCSPALAIDDESLNDGWTVYQIVRDDSADEKLTETRSQVAACVMFLRGRIAKLEDRIAALENTSAINPGETRRIQELERKVSGMQRQITILHAKKVDAPKKKAVGGIQLTDEIVDVTGKRAAIVGVTK